jgi:hypothetical protein
LLEQLVHEQTVVLRDQTCQEVMAITSAAPGFEPYDFGSLRFIPADRLVEEGTRSTRRSSRSADQRLCLRPRLWRAPRSSPYAAARR